VLKIEIITPTGLSWIISGESISLPGVVGRFQILSKHLPILSNLSEGQIVVKGIIINKIVICIRKYRKHNIYKKVILLSKQNILRKTVLGFLKKKPLFFKFTKHNLKNVYIRFRKIHQIRVSLLLLKTYLTSL
jgi:hypothetical protein